MSNPQFMNSQGKLITQGKALNYGGYYIGPELDVIGQPIETGYCVYPIGIDYLIDKFPTLEEAQQRVNDILEKL